MNEDDLVRVYGRCESIKNYLAEYSELLDNIKTINYVSDIAYEILSNQDIDYEPSKVVGEDETVRDVAKILYSIEPKYAHKFANQIKNETIYFSFNHEFSESSYTYYPNTKEEFININMNHNYGDVKLLVHEFMHSLNGINTESKNVRELTEFISIYFEIYANRYLQDEGVNSKDIDSKTTIQNLYNRLAIMRSFQNVFSACLNDNYLVDIEDLKRTALLFEIVEKQGHDLNAFIAKNYKYIVCTLLAIYASYKVKPEDIAKLNDEITIQKHDKLNSLELLKKHNIKMDDEFKNDIAECMDHYFDEFKIKKYDKVIA